jgi:predicted nucleic-acid-binding Zn-ribbon protein
MDSIDELLAEKFTCQRCHTQRKTRQRRTRLEDLDTYEDQPDLAHVERLAMSGTGLSRFFEIQAYRYAFVSCPTCGYTEVFNLRILEGRDDLGTFLEVLFAD